MIFAAGIPAAEHAQPDDMAQIAQLVNRAYRPGDAPQGWTHEAELVSGARITAAQVAALFGDDSSVLVVRQDTHVVACVHVVCTGPSCTIGMLATDPQRQSLGVGKHLLAAAEHLARQRYGAKVLTMFVLSERPELLAYYQRRGYALTGRSEPYPVNAHVGFPVKQNLRVLVLEKQVDRS